MTDMDELDPMDSSIMRPGEALEIVDDNAVDAHSDDNVDDAPGSDMQIFEDDSVQGFFDHTEPIYSVACSPINSALILTGSGDDSVCQWNLTTGMSHGPALTKHSDSVIAVGYSHDGAMFATAGMDGIVLVYDGRDSHLLHTLDGPSSEIEWMTWHPRGPIIAIGCSDGTAWIWHVSPKSSSVMQVLTQESSMTCGAFAGAEGKTLCTAGEDGSVRVWSCRSGKITTLFRAGPTFHEEAVCALDTHPSQPIIMTGSQNHTAKWAQIGSGKVLGVVADHSAPVEAVAFARPELGQNWAATGDMAGTICIVDVDRGTVRARVAHDDGVVKMVWLRRRPHLLCSCSLDGTVRVWDVRTAACLKRFRGHTGPVYDIAISIDERFVISCSEDHVALVFSLEDDSPS